MSPEEPEEIQSLLGLLHKRCGVGTPGEVLPDGDAQELEVGHPLHTLPANEQRLDVCSVPPVVHHNLFGLRRVEDQVVVPTLPKQPLHLVPVSGLISFGDEPNYGGIVRKLNKCVAVVGGAAVVCV